MNIRNVNVERLSVVSDQSFDRVVAKLTAAIGHPDLQKLANAGRDPMSYEEYARLVRSMVGPSEFMEMLRLDIGAVLRKASGPSAPRSWRFILGNPVIMQQMASRVPDAASYAPVTILVDERPDGVHLSYDRMVSLLAPYGDQEALRVADSLDKKIERLLIAATSKD
jgi:uncharacterized protein (DUF302 family)